jgi:glycosyltransferase involved in cell wall biosynthesis
MIKSVSIVICTRNRADSLLRTLACVNAIDVPPGLRLQVVVVDNGSTDRTAAAVKNNTNNLPIDYLLHEHAGTSRARNAGIAAATGDLIMFTDDDCLVPPNWVMTTVQLFGDDLLQLIGGRVDLHDPAHLPLAIKVTTEREVLSNASNLIGFMHGANFAFGRAVVDRIGVFDIRLGAGAGLGSSEDADFVYRAMRAGIPVIYQPEMRVSHDHRRVDPVEGFKQIREYSIGAGAMMAKHLLQGKADLVKMNYWDFRTAMRRWQADRKDWRWLYAKTGLIQGAVRYLCRASWRRAA